MLRNIGRITLKNSYKRRKMFNLKRMRKLRLYLLENHQMEELKNKKKNSQLLKKNHYIFFSILKQLQV
jgi:hypothetical protein